MDDPGASHPEGFSCPLPIARYPRVLLAHGGPSPNLIGALNQRDRIEHVVLGDGVAP